ncbi:MAG: ABC-type transport auxiliary lipoprotein family protein [Solirubrobacterales bacterium]
MTAASALRTLTAAMLLALSACASPPAPKDTFHRLEVAAPAARFQVPPLPGTLEVDRVESDGVLAERAIAYQEPGQGVQRYRYDFWSEAPGLMMQDRLAGYLRAANAAERVVTPDLRVPSDWMLRGKLRRFEQIAGAGKVAVEMQLAVVSARDGTLVMLKTYAAEIAARSDTPRDAAEAIGRGVSDILDRFVADLARAEIPKVRR